VGSIVKASDDGRYEPNDEPVVLSGELQFPAGAGPFPTVVLAHGCAGLGYGEITWAPLLHQSGYATFVIDSFGGRGIGGVCDDPWRLLSIQRVPDVYGALRILATHPKIDAQAVFLMGFSHGGTLAINAATRWARETYAPAGRPSFRGFIPFYPYCNNSFPEREAISAPLRIHTGELDDWTPARPCQEWVDRLRANGYDARITLYAGAHHAFDTPFGSAIRLPGVQNAAPCRAQFASILGPFDLAKNFSGCIVRGATVGRNAEAIQQAAQALRNELAEILTSK
jgi:dienelactone hydrolase